MATAASFAVAFLAARLLTSALICTLREGGRVVANYRGLDVARPAGLGLVMGVCAGALAGALAGAFVGELAGGVADGVAGGVAGATSAAGGGVPFLRVTALCLGMAAAGTLDDLAGSSENRGFSGHIRVLARGRLTTGAVKIVVAALVCGAVALDRRPGTGHMRPGVGGDGTTAFVVAAAAAAAVAVDSLMLAASANAVNLLDTRPGRAVKGALLLLAVVVAAGGGAWVAATAAGAALGYIRFDLDEEGMLGDAGANPLGALVGLAALELEPVRLWVALVVAIALNVASEFTSLGEAIEAWPPLAAIDRLGRRGS